MLIKKHLTYLALSAILLAPATSAFDDSADDKIANAMTAAPSSISAHATVVDADGTVLRKGSNGWTCMPIMGAPMCNDAVWMKWMETAMVGKPFSTDVTGYSYMLAGDSAAVNNEDPADKEQNDGETWVAEGPHLMLLMPSVDSMKALSNDPKVGGAYVMWKDTPMIHVMVPLGDSN